MDSDVRQEDGKAAKRGAEEVVVASSALLALISGQALNQIGNTFVVRPFRPLSEAQPEHSQQGCYER